MNMLNKGRAVLFLLSTGLILIFSQGCASSDGAYTSRKHTKYYRDTYTPSVQRADNIQYRSPYKYDMKGKKYKKHYKKKEKRNNGR